MTSAYKYLTVDDQVAMITQRIREVEASHFALELQVLEVTASQSAYPEADIRSDVKSILTEQAACRNKIKTLVQTLKEIQDEQQDEREDEE